MFAHMFGFGRQQQNASVPPTAEPRPASNPTAAHPPLPSFEEFMHLVGLPAQLPVHPPPSVTPTYPQTQQPTQSTQPSQFSAANGAPGPQVHGPHVHTHHGPEFDGLRDLANTVLNHFFPPELLGSMQMPTAPHGAAHPPPPPPGPIPFTVPNRPPHVPRPSSAEKRQWVPPPPPGPTLRERIEKKERELGLRCSDISCGLGPSDEDPEPIFDRQIHIRPPKDKADGKDRVCDHTFHPSCLVSAERVAGWSGADQKKEAEGEEEVQVSCPVCRAVGCISREDWDEGACALA